MALLWNRRDHEQDLQRALSVLITPYRTDERAYASMARRRLVNESRLFFMVEEVMFDNGDVTSVDGVAERVLSVSFIAALPSSEQTGVVAEARELARKHGRRGSVTLQYITGGYLLEARWARGSSTQVVPSFIAPGPDLLCGPRAATNA